MIGSRRSRDMTKYCYFHKDHGHDTNECHELRHHIEEALKSGQLSHLARPHLKEEVSGRTYQRAWGDHVSPVSSTNNSSDPVIIKARISRRERMGIVVSTIHGAIKFHTSKGTGTVLSTYEPPEIDERKKKSKATCSEITKNVLSCRDAKERVIVNTKYPEQTVAIEKQLPTNIKERL
ncbi:hypothetical protein Tco_0869545 [Tanacetum coccineum]